MTQRPRVRPLERPTAEAELHPGLNNGVRQEKWGEYWQKERCKPGREGRQGGGCSFPGRGSSP